MLKKCKLIIISFKIFFNYDIEIIYYKFIYCPYYSFKSKELKYIYIYMTIRMLWNDNLSIHNIS